MNTEEVMAMIDAITEDDASTFTWEGDETGDLIAVCHSNRFSIAVASEHDPVFGITDPRTAREIAGALVAWANRKDRKQVPAGHTFKVIIEWPGTQFESFSVSNWLERVTDLPGNSLRYQLATQIEVGEYNADGICVRNAVLKSRDGGADENPNLTAPSIYDWANIKSGRSSRAEWYKAHVGRMTLETLKGTRQDLKEILLHSSCSEDSEEASDIDRAINIIADELYKRDQG